MTNLRLVQLSVGEGKPGTSKTPSLFLQIPRSLRKMGRIRFPPTASPPAQNTSLKKISNTQILEVFSKSFLKKNSHKVSRWISEAGESKIEGVHPSALIQPSIPYHLCKNDATTPSPPRKNRRKCYSPLSEAKDLSCSFLWARRAIEEINLNNTVAEAEFSEECVTRRVVLPGPANLAPTPLVIIDVLRDASATRTFYVWAITHNTRNSRFAVYFF